MFEATNVVINSDKEKYVYGGYGIAFDGKSLWRFSDEFAWNVIISGIDNGSSSHTDNPKNKFLILGGGDTFCINGGFGEPEIKKSINFNKAKTKFFWVCIIMLIIVTYLWMEKKSINFKLVIKIINFYFGFILEEYLINLTTMI